AAMARVASLLGTRGAAEAGWTALAETAARFTARDYPLAGVGDDDALARFEVLGFEAVREALVRAGVPADRVAAGTVPANLPAGHPAAVPAADVPISISLIAE
ncbi:hypothetical protein HK102_009221, partial [Quaeritorhiza haematococci]